MKYLFKLLVCSIISHSFIITPMQSMRKIAGVTVQKIRQLHCTGYQSSAAFEHLLQIECDESAKQSQTDTPVINYNAADRGLTIKAAEEDLQRYLAYQKIERKRTSSEDYHSKK